MSDRDRLNVVLCWHMHQPEYRDLISGDFRLPWTYLHTIKDYVDMVAHLEAVPEARAVCNFTPLLLEQINDYAAQVDGFLNNGMAIRDPVLAALETPSLSVDPDQRIALVKACLRANQERVVQRFPPYKRLAAVARSVIEHPDMLQYVTNQYLSDLVVWYHLAWLGETVRRSDPVAGRLISQGSGFTLHDRRELLKVIGDLISGVLPRYRHLAQQGQIELSMSPYGHPIVPLMLSFDAAREAMPDVHLPHLEHYPGGMERVQWHLHKGLDVFQKSFGMIPIGCWPSEGGVSQDSLGLFSGAGFRWIATGGAVLNHSASHQTALQGANPSVHTGHRDSATGLHVFFRDDGLSDSIGFEYAKWDTEDAISNLMHHLETIAGATSDRSGSMAAIIMDGENAWEYYQENAHGFLSKLYQNLVDHSKLRLTTFSEWIAQGYESEALSPIVAGSWVYGTFSTWIGNEDKNRAWEMLGDAKRVYDVVVKSGRISSEQRERIDRQLAICEGSDWFWWFGDYNPAETVAQFDQLFRGHLANLYQLLGEDPPEYLTTSFAHGRGAPALGGVMRPSRLQ
ncbi:MAG: glycoside hydrolase family 57 protein [Gammaproteobacteria bacterium]|nr:glycoside hydrolase family 57 protein [Gammaproteobacteria bacterium]